MHALRHRFATRVYNVDRDVFAVQILLGHSSPATTQRYVQINDTALRRLVTAGLGHPPIRHKRLAGTVTGGNERGHAVLRDQG